MPGAAAIHVVSTPADDYRRPKRVRGRNDSVQLYPSLPVREATWRESISVFKRASASRGGLFLTPCTLDLDDAPPYSELANAVCARSQLPSPVNDFKSLLLAKFQGERYLTCGFGDRVEVFGALGEATFLSPLECRSMAAEEERAYERHPLRVGIEARRVREQGLAWKLWREFVVRDELQDREFCECFWGSMLIQEVGS